MRPTEAVTYTTPDGVKRAVRLTFGARKRIAAKFGMPLPEVVKRYDSAAFPDILYCCMFDDSSGGKPPEGLPADWANSLELDHEMEVELAAVFMQAILKGGVEKNGLKALIREELAKEMKTKYGLSFGPLLDSASGSLPANSGPAPNESSTPSAVDSASESGSPTIAQD